ELHLAAPRSKLRHRPVELGGRQIAGVELVNQQHEYILLLDRPVRRMAADVAERVANPLDAELGRAHVELVHPPPLRGNPAPVAESRNSTAATRLRSAPLRACRMPSKARMTCCWRPITSSVGS